MSTKLKNPQGQEVVVEDAARAESLLTRPGYELVKGQKAPAAADDDQ